MLLPVPGALPITFSIALNTAISLPTPMAPKPSPCNPALKAESAPIISCSPYVPKDIPVPWVNSCPKAPATPPLFIFFSYTPFLRCL